MAPHKRPKSAPVDWSSLIPQQEWDIHKLIIDEASNRGLRFALGGGLAFCQYSARCRNTKDMDLFIHPKDKDAFIQATIAAGYEDYFDQHEYDRSWIYRGFKDDVIVDLIWSMPNHRMDVDEEWLEGRQKISIRGTELRLLPVEEYIWSKIFVLQKDRSDWPDLLNILYVQAADLDWRRLVCRLGPDARVLGGLLCVFEWLCAERAQVIPRWVWLEVGLLPPKGDECDPDGHRAFLLDTRDWFGPPAEGG